MKPLDRAATLHVVQKILQANFSCEEKCFSEENTFLFEARETDGRMRFPFHQPFLGIMTMGKGTIVSCSHDRMDWAKVHLAHLSRDQVFSTSTIALLVEFLSAADQFLAGPDLKFVCSGDTFRSSRISDEIVISLAEGEEIRSLYQHAGFRHALSYQPRSLRPDVLAAVAMHDKKLVGIAGASADCDEMWQVGVDVVSDYRGRGIGKALVSKLTGNILLRRRVPYYSTAISNLSSRNVAIGVGYWPAWVELYAREKG